MSVLELLPLPKKKKSAQGKAKAAGAPVFKPVVIERYNPPVIASPHPIPTRLKGKLAGLGRRYRMVNVGVRLAQIVAAAIVLITLQMGLDWLVGLHVFVRALLLAGDFALLYFFSRKYLFPVLLHSLSEEDCALMVEKHWPRLRGKIIAAVQFSRPRSHADSPQMVSLLQQDADTATGVYDFGLIVPGRPLTRRVGIAVVLALVFGALMFFTAPGSIALLERVFLIPAKVPRKTDVICLTGSKTIPAGETIFLRAQAKGIIPSHGRVTLTYDSGRIQEVTLDPEKDKTDIFSLKVEKVEEPFTYVIRLNDGISDKYTISVVPRPGVANIECEQIYPAYTGLENMKRTVGNLALLAGSRLKIHATANSKIEKASLKLIGIDKVLPVTIGPDGKDLTAEITIPATDLTGFSLQLTNAAGVSSGDETQYRIDLIPDRPPSVQLTYPERLQELYTLKATVLMAFVVTDDYGIAKLDLCYRKVSDQEATPDANGNLPPPPEPKRIELNLGDGHPTSLKNRYEWKLSSITPALTEGTTLEYWLEARDANNITGPGIGESEHHVIKIVSPADKMADIMDRLNSGLSILSETQTQQTDLNTQLGNLIQGKNDSTNDAPVSPTPPSP